MEDTIHFLEEGEKNIQIDHHKDIVLILGNTGAGKSTFTQYIAGDNDQLISVELGEGTGEFIIEDENRISSSTINSKTIYPELVVNQATDTAFYDCPGFSDTRSTTIDIGAIYFIKKLIDHARSVKLIFIVNYSSVRKGVDRHDFMILLRHISMFVKNIDKYRDSMALVVTKVDNQYKKQGRNLVLVSDEKVIINIAEFMEEVKAALEEKVQVAETTEKERFFYTNGLQLLDTFLSKENEKFVKIGLFRRPDESGPLSKIPLLQDGKRPVEEIIYNNTKFIYNGADDFGYTVSEKSKNDIFDLAEEINKEIGEKVSAIAGEIKHHYKLKVLTSDDIVMLRNELNANYDYFIEVTEKMLEIYDPHEFLKQIIKTIKDLNINIYAENVKDILQKNEYLNFLHILNDKGVKTRPQDWVKSLNEVTEYVRGWKNWYKFLIDLKTKLSEYEVQSDTSRYNVANVAHWGHVGKPQGINITPENIHEFLKILEMPEDNIKSIDIDSLQLNDLNKMLDITLKEKVKLVCTNTEKLEIRGNFVKLSDVIKFSCLGAINSIEIFAADAVFIDEDFIKTGDQLRLSIIAPNWKGKKSIILDGVSGNSHSYFKASDGYYPSSSGSHGSPGLPGENSGNFFGIGNKFDQFKVSAVGGVGGPGQAGGNGAAGRDGETPVVEKNKTLYYFKSDRETPLPQYMYNLDSRTVGAFCSGGLRCEKQFYTIYGKAGGNGGNGGNGGKGGVGGVAGNVDIIPLDGNLLPQIISLSGRKGADGNGGDAASGGINGDTLKTEHLYSSWYLGFIFWSNSEWYINKRINGGRASSGSRGTRGGNSNNIKSPDPAKRIEFPAGIINRYKSYLRENLGDNIRRHSLNEFYDRLTTNDKIKSLFDVSGFLDELQSLEAQFYEYRNKIEFLPFYQSLLKRISDFSENFQSSSSEHKKVLAYLYTSTLSKICSLKNSFENNLITDVNEYLNIVSGNIENLHEIKSDITTNKYKTEYSSGIENKMKEAKNLITKFITPEIEQMETGITKKIEALVIEIAELRAKSVIEHEELIKKRQELEKDMLTSFVAQILKIASRAVFFFVNSKEAIEGLIEIVSGVAPQFELKQVDRNPLQFPSTLKNIITTVRDEFVGLSNKKFEKMENIIANEEMEETENGTAVDLETRLKNNTLYDNVFDVYIKYKVDKMKIEEINDALSKVEKKIVHLRHHEQKVYATLVPMLTSMLNDLNVLETTLTSKSRLALDITKWQIQSALKDLKITVKSFTKGFDIEDGFLRCVEKLNEAIGILINVYDRMQHFQYQEQLAKYIANIASSDSKQIQVKDGKLNNAILSLESQIRSNAVLGHFEKAVSAFKQHMFPFAERHLEEIHLATHFKLNAGFKNLVSVAIQQIEKLKMKLIESNSSILKNHDEYIHRREFSSRYNSIKPFFVWRNLEFKKEILELLSGKDVILKADAVTGSHQNAIKFNFAELILKTSNASLQKEVDDLLKHFHVVMTHLGTSYYKCDKKFYVIMSEEQVVKYSFEKNTEGRHVDTNAVYNKIMGGDFMLSPYAMWSVKLNTTNSTNFNKLLNYRHHIDLELSGYGQYVSEQSDICDKKLENYYQLDETMNELNNIDLGEDDFDTEPAANRKRRDVFYANKRVPTGNPINSTFKWLAEKVHNLNPFKRENYLTFPTIENNFEKNNSSINFADLNHTIALVDVLVRKLTGAKPLAFNESSVSSLEAQGVALNIIYDFENLLEDETEFDPVELQSQLVQAIMRQDYCKLFSLLFQFDLNNDKFASEVSKIVEKNLPGKVSIGRVKCNDLVEKMTWEKPPTQISCNALIT